MYQLYLQGVKQNGHLLRYVPDKCKTIEMCESAIMGNNSNDALKYVPKHYLTLDLCKRAANRNGRCLRHVPNVFITDEVIYLAVINDPIALTEVYDKIYRYRPFVLAFVKKYRTYYSSSLPFTFQHKYTNQIMFLPILFIKN